MTTEATPDFYKVLGVARDATHAQVKAAFRTAAGRAHPDRNKDAPPAEAAAAMAAINKAWEVLGDPERRADYDASGVDHDAASIEEDGRMLLMEYFDKAATDEMVRDIVNHIRNVLHGRLAECQAEIASAHKIVTRFNRVRMRVKVKKDGQTNLFHHIVDKKIKNVERTVPQNQRLQRVAQAALKILADYESVEDGAYPAEFDSSRALPGVRRFLGGPRL